MATTYGFELPSAHQAILRCTNGIEVFFGYFRLFGLESAEAIDAIDWNMAHCWKFSWGERCNPYWCFGETAWGDQYAYMSDELRSGRDSVYFLDALSMTAELIAATFDEFFEREFIRCARMPYDEMIMKAYALHGELDPGSHIAYVPSPLIGGSEHRSNIERMDARAAMVCNGDLAIQIEQSSPEDEIKGIQAYQDIHGRMRLRILWK